MQSPNEGLEGLDDLQEFNEGLTLSDEALCGLDQEAYKGWIESMMAGIVALAYECSEVRAASRGDKHTARAAKSFDCRKKTIEKWRQVSEAFIEGKTFIRTKDSTRLNTKHRFAYIAGLLRVGEWYLVSLLDARKRDQQGGRLRLAD